MSSLGQKEKNESENKTYRFCPELFYPLSVRQPRIVKQITGNKYKAKREDAGVYLFKIENITLRKKEIVKE